MQPRRPLSRQMKFAGVVAISFLVLPIFSGCEDKSALPTDPSRAQTRQSANPSASAGAGMVASADGPGITTTTLPFQGVVTSPLVAWAISQGGTGAAGRFYALNTSGGMALEARSDGTGPAFVGWTIGPSNAGIFEVRNSQSTADVVRILNGGLGKGLTIATSLSANNATALDITNAGSGRGLQVIQQLSNQPSPAVEVFTAGPGPGLLIQSNVGTSGRFIGQGSGTNSVMVAVNGSGDAPAVHGVASNLATGNAAKFEGFNTANVNPLVVATNSGTGAVLQLNQTGTAGPFAVFRLNGVNQIRFARTGRGFFNGGTQTGGADVAEAFEVVGNVGAYQPGDVLEIDTRSDRRVTRSGEAYSTRIIGVYATKPGVLLTELNIDDPMDHMVPVGVIGVIPTKVTAENGVIHRGDLLVSAGTRGHAMRADRRRLEFGMVLGKALEEFSGPGSGLIRVLVNVK
jgi:hypothetical protein